MQLPTPDQTPEDTPREQHHEEEDEEEESSAIILEASIEEVSNNQMPTTLIQPRDTSQNPKKVHLSASPDSPQQSPRQHQSTAVDRSLPNTEVPSISTQSTPKCGADFREAQRRAAKLHSDEDDDDESSDSDSEKFVSSQNAIRARSVSSAHKGGPVTSMSSRRGPVTSMSVRRGGAGGGRGGGGSVGGGRDAAPALQSNAPASVRHASKLFSTPHSKISVSCDTVSLSPGGTQLKEEEAEQVCL